MRYFLLCGCLIFFNFFSFSIAQEKRGFPARVIEVIDGDSLQVRANGRVHELRLYGIDAPEHDQHKAWLARSWLRTWLLGRKVVIEVVATDRYGRLVSLVYKGEKVANEEMVTRGLAWVYSKYCHAKICRGWKKAEAQARAERRGIWRGRHLVPPWVWRHR